MSRAKPDSYEVTPATIDGYLEALSRFVAFVSYRDPRLREEARGAARAIKQEATASGMVAEMGSKGYDRAIGLLTAVSRLETIWETME